MLLGLILGLAFASLTILTWQFYPVIGRRMERLHAQRLNRDVQKLDQMFVEVPRKNLFLIYLLSPIVVGIIGLLLTQSWVAGLAFSGLGIVLPTLGLRIMEKNRTRKFGRQLIDGLMVLSSSLKGGLSLIQAIEVLVEEMPAPISQEFALVLRENKIGVPLDEALENLNQRIKSEDLNLVVTAVDIARETGGNLTEPFEKLMFTIRERDKLIAKVKTLTLQAKLQGIIMSLMPVIFGIVVYYLNPSFFTIMLRSSIGRMLLGVAGILEAIGAFLLWKLSQVDV